MKPVLQAIAAALAAAALTSPASAQTLGPGSGPVQDPIPFSAFDLDGDGTVTHQEFNAVRGRRIQERASRGGPMGNLSDPMAFTKIDRNKDNRLTPEELADARKGHRPPANGGLKPTSPSLAPDGGQSVPPAPR